MSMEKKFYQKPITWPITSEGGQQSVGKPSSPESGGMQQSLISLGSLKTMESHGYFSLAEHDMMPS
jgi:hypothetical protein